MALAVSSALEESEIATGMATVMLISLILTALLGVTLRTATAKPVDRVT
jgi:hypothetical protein